MKKKHRQADAQRSCKQIPRLVGHTWKIKQRLIRKSKSITQTVCTNTLPFSLPSREIRTLGQVSLPLLSTLKVSLSVIFKRTWSGLLASLLMQLGLGKDRGWAYKRYVSVTRGTRTGQLGLGKERDSWV